MHYPEPDPRLAQWPFMESPIPVIVIVVAYLVFVKLVGPAYMKNRKPYELRAVMLFYNFALVGYNAWIFFKLGKHGWFGRYKLLCEPLDLSTEEESMQIAVVSWHYIVSKLVELLDTVLFVLRKKDSNISFLHVSHHGSVPIIVRDFLGRGAGGYNTFFALLNSFVHIWMYLYYALAAIGPAMQKYLWWKRYLTALQMVQLSTIATFMLVNYALCDVDPYLLVSNIAPCLFFLALFADFYRRSYRGRGGSAHDPSRPGVFVHPRLRDKTK